MDLQRACLSRSKSRSVVTTSPQPALDRRVGQVAPNSRIEWLHTDYLGSTRSVTAARGAVASRHKYLPFGKEYVDDSSGSPNPHKFTGHERDAGTGLDYMYARFYGPQNLFRFLSVDPGDATSLRLPQSWNYYAYVRNRPLVASDPTGESPTVGMAAGGALLGGGLGLGIELVKQAFAGEFDGQKLGAATLGGATTGFITGLTGGTNLIGLTIAGAHR